MKHTRSVFTEAILQWFDRHGRKSLPWQKNRNPYHIWVSEIMLQQTQVETVIPYYQKFIKRFPTITDLASASSDDVMAHWAGLGYYARARNLHKAAKQICEKHQGVFPTVFADVVSLPGIGPSTAGAILAFSFNQRHPILDGNVKRVLTRYYAILGYPGKKAVENELWKRADELTPDQRISEYTQAIMDLGATLCTRSKPRCTECPVMSSCSAYANNTVSRYPESKPASVRKQKSTRMLLIRNREGKYLLVKRPPSGIWGGLWSLPQIDDADTDHQQWSRSTLGFEIGTGYHLQPISHGFTHFELLIKPILCTVVGITSEMIMDAEQYLWYNPDIDPSTTNQTGMPAAIKRLFNNLASDNLTKEN